MLGKNCFGISLIYNMVKATFTTHLKFKSTNTTGYVLKTQLN